MRVIESMIGEQPVPTIEKLDQSPQVVKLYQVINQLDPFLGFVQKASLALALIIKSLHSAPVKFLNENIFFSKPFRFNDEAF